MLRIAIVCMSLLFSAGLAKSEGAPKTAAKELGGMSIVGNDEAPKSLAIVPWKGSQLGETLSAIKALDAGRQPVDKEVFIRELDYYQIMAGGREARTPAKEAHQQ